MRRYLWMALLLLAGCTGQCIHPYECAAACSGTGVAELTSKNGCVCNKPKEPGK